MLPVSMGSQKVGHDMVTKEQEQHMGKKTLKGLMDRRLGSGGLCPCQTTTLAEFLTLC